MIEALAKALRELNVNVVSDRWWESQLRADVIHYFGRPPALNVRLAREKGYKVVFTDILDSTASRSRMALMAQRVLITALQKGFKGFVERLGWDVYRMVDAYVTIVAHEGDVARYLFNVPAARCYVVPHGLTGDSLKALAQEHRQDDYLFSLATIHPRKNNLELARSARKAGVPVVFAGKPYAKEDPYFDAFMKEVDGVIVRYAGFVTEEEKIKWMAGARGFVLCSEYESGCIAVYEAAAAGLPLLLSDKPWARRSYPHCPRLNHADVLRPDAPDRLRSFYEKSQRLPGTQTFPVSDWRDVGREYLNIYQKVLLA